MSSGCLPPSPSLPLPSGWLVTFLRIFILIYLLYAVLHVCTTLSQDSLSWGILPGYWQVLICTYQPTCLFLFVCLHMCMCVVHVYMCAHVCAHVCLCVRWEGRRVSLEARLRCHFSLIALYLVYWGRVSHLNPELSHLFARLTSLPAFENPYFCL